MASIFGDDPFGNGTLVGGRRRPTTAGYGATFSGATAPDPAPSGMPGTPNNPNTGINPNAGSAQPSPFSTSTIPTQRVTSLSGFDSGKLGDASHLAKSPKYQFGSLAPFYGRGQENELLHQLQSQYGNFWNGWSFDGRGNFVYGGDPNALNSAWDGVRRVDAYLGYNGGGPLTAQWGIEDGSPAASAMPDLGGLLNSFSAPASAQPDLSWLGPLMQSVISGMQPQSAPAPMPSANVPMAAPPLAPSYSQPSPTFGGGYVTPGYGNDGANATSLLSMALPQIMQSRGSDDPLVRQILQLVQGGR